MDHGTDMVCLRAYCSDHKWYELRYFCPSYLLLHNPMLLSPEIHSTSLCVAVCTSLSKTLYWEKTYQVTRSSSLCTTLPSSLTPATVQPWCIFMLHSRTWCKDSSANNECLASNQKFIRHSQSDSEPKLITLLRHEQEIKEKSSHDDRPQWAILCDGKAARSWRQLFPNLIQLQKEQLIWSNFLHLWKTL